MGACYSKPAEEVIIDEQDRVMLNAQADTLPAGYQIEPVIDQNMDAGFVDGEVVTSASNANLAIPAQTVATEVVYQDGQQPQPQPLVSNEVIYQDNGATQRMHSWASIPEIPVYSAVNGAAVEVGVDEFNAEQTGRTSMATIGRASVTTVDTGVQNIGIVQESIGDVMGAVNLNSMDKQGSEVYDPDIGAMVYVLDNNQSFDDLEPVTTAYIRGSVGNFDAGNAVVTNVGRDSVLNSMEHALVEPATTEYITTVNESEHDVSNFLNPNFQSPMNDLSKNQMPTSNNPLDDGVKVYDQTIGEFVQVPGDKASVREMDVLPMNETSCTGNLNDVQLMRASADMGATEPPNRVFDETIGEMVQVLDHRASVDNMELINVNTRT